MVSYQWSDDSGHSGTAIPFALNTYRDLASLCADGPDFPVVGTVAAQPPAVGERVRIVGYDWRNRAAAYATRVWEVKVTRIVARHIVMLEGSDFGSSGSCVLDASGKIVGIMSRLTPVEGLGSSYAGVAVGVWGDALAERQKVCPEPGA
jgi:hypothetical protein